MAQDTSQLTDTQIEHLLDFDTVEKLKCFKDCYGKSWRDVALCTIALSEDRKKLDELINKDRP